MKTICVNASKQYSIHIGHDLLKNAGDIFSSLFSGKKCAIISDSNVFPLYGITLSKSLESAGFSVYNYCFSAGEEQKNAETYLNILNFLAKNNFTRSDILIALGGGVTGDITGFAAATFMRGISYVQIPTTLLAMVDSSVGGKTAIDLPEGKNLVGAFYQPSVVLCDLNTLDSLPLDTFRDGCAEIIKYSILYDPDLFAHLAKQGINFHREYVIPRCVELKADVVQNDEYDTSTRQLLNLGHTIGHAIEAQSCYTVTHGKAVAAGMAVVAKASWKQGFCSEHTYNQICNILEVFGLPKTTPYSPAQLYHNALSDKKRAGSTLNMIIPVDIGSCIIKKLPIDELKIFIEEGL